jgi:chitin-binding protein
VTALVLAGLVTVSAFLLLRSSPPAVTGATVAPPSRSVVCGLGGSDRSGSPACQTALVIYRAAQESTDDDGLGGIGDAAGGGRELNVDGQLCSAGRASLRGLDLALADWPATPMTSGTETTLRFALNQRQDGTLKFYLSRQGYVPTRPLTRQDLDPTPLAQVTGSPDAGGNYRLRVTLPQRTGRQLLYATWQRADGTATVSSCSDLVFAPQTVLGPAGVQTPATPGPSASATGGDLIQVSASPDELDSIAQIRYAGDDPEVGPRRARVPHSRRGGFRHQHHHR